MRAHLLHHGLMLGLCLSCSASLRAESVGLRSMDGFWLAFYKQHPQGEFLAKASDAGLAQIRRGGS